MRSFGRAVVAFVACVALVGAPLTAVAQSVPTELQLMIATAQKDYDNGEYEKAADEFMIIYSRDPQLGLALYNAGRAMQLADQLDKAAKIYKVYLKLPGLAPTQVRKVEAHLHRIDVRWAERRASQARDAERDMHYTLALARWLRAVRLDPDTPLYLARAGRMAQLSGHKTEARTRYEQYLARSLPGAGDRADVERWLGELGPPDASVDPVLTELEQTADGSDDGVEETRSTTRGYLVAGSGAAFLIAGVVVLGLAKRAQNRYDENVAIAANSGGQFQLNAANAASESSKINRNYAIGASATAIGAAACTIGLWWAWRTPKSTVTLAPTGTGAILTVNF